MARRPLVRKRFIWGSILAVGLAIGLQLWSAIPPRMPPAPPWPARLMLVVPTASPIAPDAAAPSQITPAAPKMPPGTQSFEFNGMTVYVMPVGRPIDS